MDFWDSWQFVIQFVIFHWWRILFNRYNICGWKTPICWISKYLMIDQSRFNLLNEFFFTLYSVFHCDVTDVVTGLGNDSGPGPSLFLLLCFIKFKQKIINIKLFLCFLFYYSNILLKLNRIRHWTKSKWTDATPVFDMQFMYDLSNVRNFFVYGKEIFMVLSRFILCFDAETCFHNKL